MRPETRLVANDASTERFKLTYFDPPDGLERHVLTLFSLEWNERAIEDRHPGALGQLFITLRGTGTIRFSDHEDRVGAGAAIYSGFDRGAPFALEGPWHCIGASLSPFGWAALTGQPADRYANRLVPAADLLGGAVDDLAGDLLRQHAAGALHPDEACRKLADWIGPRLAAIPPAHEAVIEKTIGWLATSLNPPVDELFEAQFYSRRQVERLVQRYFGFTPRALSRKFRAIRAAGLLSRADLTDEGEAEIAAAFYDQPHMVREIRHFCGFTPSRLGGEGEPMFQTLLRLRNLDRLKQFRTIG